MQINLKEKNSPSCSKVIKAGLLPACNIHLNLKVYIVALCLLFCLLTSQSNAQSIPVEDVQIDPLQLDQVVTRPDEQFLILKINLGRYTLTDSLIAYHDFDQDRYYIAFTDFTRALEFPIEVSSFNKKAKGWFIDEKSTLDLDLTNNKLLIAGEERKINHGDVERHEDDIYVSLKTLQKWFPILLTIDFGELAIIVESLKPLPLEVRIARDAKRGSIQKNNNQNDDTVSTKLDTPAFTIPVIDTSTQIRFSDNPTQDQELNTTFSATSQGIVADQDVTISVSDTTGDDVDPTIRLELSKQDPDGNLFEPLGLTEYQFGDVISNALPLISDSSSGRGAFISNFAPSSNRQSRNNTVVLRGPLLTGYQVDLVRNGQILDFIEEPNEDGEYVFEDVDLFQGLNVFNLVFYGPQGQTETQEERIFVPNNPVEKGAFNYRASVIQDNTNLLTDRNNSNDEDTGETRFAVETEYGLTGTSALYGALGGYSLDGVRRNFFLVGYGASLGGIRTDFRVAKNDDNGTAYGVQLQGVTSDIRWQLEHQFYDDYISEETTSSTLPGILTSQTEARISGVFPIGFNHTLPLSLNVEYLTDDQDNTFIETSARVTQNIEKIRLTTELNNISQTGQETETDLNFLIGSRYKDFNIRGSANFELSPDTTFSSASIASDFFIFEDISLRTSFTHNRNENSTINAVTLGLSKEFDDIRVNFNLSQNDQSNTVATIGLSQSFGYDPHHNKLIRTADRLSTRSILSARTFLDNNNNSLYDEGDELLPDVSFEGRSISNDLKTNKDGLLYLTNLSSYTDTPIDVNASSLSDPFLSSALPKQNYRLRPGVIYHKDFPIVNVGEIDGAVLTFLNNQEVGAQSIILEARNPITNEVKNTASSEFDGFFLMQGVLLGNYLIAPQVEQLERLGYCPVQSRPVTLTTQDPFTSVKTFKIYPKELPEEQGKLIKLSTHETLEEAHQEWYNWQTNFFDLFETTSPFYAQNAEDSYDIFIGLFKQEDEIKQLCTTLFKTEEACQLTNWNFCPIIDNSQ